MKKCVFFIGLSLLLCMGVVKGQATVRGVLFDSSNGEAIPFANVTLVAQDSTLQSRRTYGAATDLGGVFVISKVPTGNYTIRVRYVGYEEIVSPVSVAGSQTLKLKLNMNRSATLLHTVEIRDSRAEERKMQTSVSVEKITARQIEQMPSVGGQSDLAQYLQVLPGVSSTGDQGGQLHIRGGSMIQNLCLLDGMIVYNPFHSIGLYSIFETDMLLNVDVYTGGFGAEYGGRISSVMDITTRDGNKHRHSGSVGLNTFGASAMLEGPLKKETPQSKSTITYILSAKNSYLSKSSKVFYPSIEGGLPFDYMDLYGKLTLNSGTGSKVSLYGFRYDDSVHNYQDVANYHWVNYGLGGRFSVLTGSSAVLDGAVAYSDYRIGLNDVSGLDKYSAINGLNMSFDVTNFFGQNRLKCGMSMESYSTDYLFYNSYKLRTEQQEHTNSISGYGTFRWILDKWILEPGLRYIYYNSLSEGSLEPRLAAKYKCSDKLRLKFSGGMYSQVFLDARSDNDIVNLFSGFLTSVHLNKPATFSGREASSCVQRSSHLVLGVEYDFSPHLTTNAEVYMKYYRQLFAVNHNKMFDRNDMAYQPGGVYAKELYYLTDFMVEQGLAYGLDMSVCYDIERLYLWLTYSLAHVTRTDEVQTYAPHYDRRHTINLLATYTIGSQKDWEVSARWTYGSGFPYTQTQGIYELWAPATIADSYTQSNGQYGILYADIYQGRLPAYHRLDIGVKRKISIGARSLLELSAGVTNLYNRDNLFYFDRISLLRVDQLPFLWTAGAKFSF